MRELDAVKRLEQEKLAADGRAAHLQVQLEDLGRSHAQDRDLHMAVVEEYEDRITALEAEIAHLRNEMQLQQQTLDGAVVDQMDQLGEVESYKETNTELIFALQEIVDKGGRGGLAIAKRVLGLE